MEKVYQIILANSKKTGNGSGIPVIQIMKDCRLQYRDIFPHLKELIESGKVIVREGINHQILFAV